MKHTYRLSKVDSKSLTEASKILHAEQILNLWELIGHRMGFDSSTVKMIDSRRFLAEPIVKEQVDG